jgi:hypothetical protein
VRLRRARFQPADTPQKIVARINDKLRAAGMNRYLVVHNAPHFETDDPMNPGQMLRGPAFAVEASDNDTGPGGKLMLHDNGNVGQSWLMHRLNDLETNTLEPGGNFTWQTIFDSGKVMHMLSDEGEHGTRSDAMFHNPTSVRVVFTHYDGHAGDPDLGNETDYPSHRIMMHEAFHVADYLSGRSQANPAQPIVVGPERIAIPGDEPRTIGLMGFSGAPTNENTYAAAFGLARRNIFAHPQELDENGEMWASSPVEPQQRLAAAAPTR